MTGVRTCRVPSFGYLRINACLRLPTAFRSLPRPSSAISAKASSLCSYSLDLCSLIFAIKHLIGFPHCLGACKILYWNLTNEMCFYSLCSFQGTMVGESGLEPPTSRLSGVCSNQLSYEPVLVEVIGFEPMTPCLQGRCSTS